MKLPWVLFLFWEFWLRRPMIEGFKPWFSSLCVFFLAPTSIRSLMKFLIGQYVFYTSFVIMLTCNGLWKWSSLLIIALSSSFFFELVHPCLLRSLKIRPTSHKKLSSLLIGLYFTIRPASSHCIASCYHLFEVVALQFDVKNMFTVIRPDFLQKLYR